ncbi:uncharacterized protein G6M90_00g030260 [Metarhizium brunneum]|uniref:Uncharacterized protein n=1 Tax=Metarhizium brunneum TaxID=500148 RepID=A0A7D5UW94_9HYPO|nr:hypothetical protein G6M90_00g030260 [Metarhizium brunneum]
MSRSIKVSGAAKNCYFLSYTPDVHAHLPFFPVTLSMDSQTGDRISFNLSEDRNALPQSLLQTVCSKLYVELLKTTTPEQGQHGEEGIAEKKQAANHAVFKIIFADKCGTYEGMRLEVICLMRRGGFIQSTDISEVLAGPDLSVRSIYEALGFRLDYRGRIWASPIDKGRFPWRHYQSPLMPYHGSQKALELAELWAPSSLHVPHSQNLDKDIGQ